MIKMLVLKITTKVLIATAFKSFIFHSFHCIGNKERTGLLEIRPHVRPLFALFELNVSF